MRHLSFIDNLIVQADRTLRTIAAVNQPVQRPSPANNVAEEELSTDEKRHAAGLMRVNHAGEVCAQALYQGQAFTARLPKVRNEMEKAAIEEVDHLMWCQKRLEELDSHTSYLNPLWYGLSFAIGASAGLINDKVSLGFVAATEEQVCKHLIKHLDALPKNDVKSKAIVSSMLRDEARHADMALHAGGYRFPLVVKGIMRLMSTVMTKTSYRV